MNGRESAKGGEGVIHELLTPHHMRRGGVGGDFMIVEKDVVEVILEDVLGLIQNIGDHHAWRRSSVLMGKGVVADLVHQKFQLVHVLHCTHRLHHPIDRM